MTSNLSTLQLNAIDVASDYYVDIAYILRGAAAPTLAQVRLGAQYLSRQFPQFAGHIVGEHLTLVDYDPEGNTPVEVHDNGALDFSVQDFGRGSIQSPGFQHEGVDGFNYFASADPALHKMAWAVCRYTQLRDGCFLAVSVHHRVCDARGTALFTQALAYMTRVGITHTAAGTTPSFPLQDLPPHLHIRFDRSQMNANMDFSAPVETTFPENDFLRKFEELRPMSCFTGVDMSRPAATLTFRFTAEQALVVKAAALARAQRHGYTSYISTRDALVGYLFTLHLAATHLHNRDNGIPEEDARIGLCVAIDTRGHFGEDEQFAGNAALIAFARGHVLSEWLTGVGAAAVLRRCLVTQHPALTRQLAGWIHNVTEGRPLNDPVAKVQLAWTHGLTQGGFGDGCSTDWSRMGWEDAHFTLEGEGLYNAQRSADPITAVPWMIVTPPNVVLPGHIKLINDTTTRDSNSFLLQLYTGWEQWPYLKPGGELHHATLDLEWIGKDFDLFTPPPPSSQ